MMKRINHFILAVSIFLILPTSAFALEVANQSSNVFKFQQKLAAKGNARAQYELAIMYETGVGIALDIRQAKHWYKQASTGGVKAADNREVYLSIKEQGYNKAAGSDWLSSLKKEAKSRDGDAMFLLAQLYREGFGVKKDLNKSLSLLDQVSVLGAADVENETTLILEEMDANDARAKKRALNKKEVRQPVKKKPPVSKKRAVEKQTKTAPKIEQQASIKPKAQPQSKSVSTKQAKIKPVSKKSKKEQQADAATALQAEKIRRYEKAMMKIKLEQQQIDEQQAWAAGDTAETADDEI